MVSEKGSSRLRVVSAYDRFRMDCETPVSLYLKLAANHEYAFILESVEQGMSSARYSFIGWNPILHVTYKPPRLELKGFVQGTFETGDPLAALQRILAGIELVDEVDIPDSRGGVVGYFGFDFIRLKENIGAVHDSDIPWFELIMPENLLVFDHLNHTVTIICHQPDEGDTEKARALAQQQLKHVLHEIRVHTIPNVMNRAEMQKPSLDAWRSNLDKDQFCRIVEKAKQYIFEGDIFQVVLSRVLRRSFQGDPFEVYRSLRQLNPSPYMYYLNYGGRAVVGGSPEALVSVNGPHIATKPIAGTRPRGETYTHDLELERELLADEKEIAEHVMLVDLGRNDLGRIAVPGSVEVPKFKVIERYSHVMHIVSEVEARLRPDLNALDALVSVFPAGTLSGAPKIRAMEIISELEPESRGVYGGAIGFIDLNGNMDTCITIRTAYIAAGEARVQAGAGIVADSVPEKEFEETIHKSMSMVCAVEMAAGDK